MATDESGIIILGHPRSGTTLLRRLLDGHSRIACPPETHILSACARFLETEVTSQGVDLGVLSGLSFAGFPDHRALEELRDFAFSFLRRYADAQGKPRWAEKTAFDVFHTEEIEQLCAGHVRFVCVVRHALDVAVSTREFCDSMGVYPRVLHSFIQADPQPIRAFARSWLDVAEKLDALCTRNPDSSKMLRYEDLVASPENVLGDLLEFLGEDYEPAMLERGLGATSQLGFGDHKSYGSTSVHGASLARWKTLPDFQVASLSGLLNPMLERLGYPALDSNEGTDSTTARQRYLDNLDRLQKRARISPVTPENPPEPTETVNERPFLVYDLGNRTRSRTTFTLGKSIADGPVHDTPTGGAARLAEIATVTAALLRRVSEYEEILLGVAVGDPAPKGDRNVVTIAVANTEGYRFTDILDKVESGISGKAGPTVPDIYVGESRLALHGRPAQNSPGAADRATEPCPVLAIEYEEKEDGLALEFTFDEGIWTRELGARFVSHYLMMHRAMREDPAQLVDTVSMLTEEEKRILFPEEPTAPREIIRTDDKFFAQVAQHPDKVALVFEGQTLTYSELGRRVESLAGFIQSRGVRGGTVIAVCMYRSLDLVTSLLAVMHVGATYVPLDPNHPDSRIRQILEDAQPAFVLTEKSLREKIGIVQGDRLISIDEDDWRNHASSVPEPLKEAELAYIIFTSGSTGRPKGVEVLHHGLSTFLDAMAKQPGLTEDDRLLSVTTVSFDIAALELFLPLSVGATLVLASRRQTMDGKALSALLEEYGITVFQATPATYQLLLSAGWQGRADIKLLCGGEALPADLAARLLECCGELWNMYGPTETTIWSTIKKVEAPESPMPIGSPIHGTRVYVLNEQQEPVPIGVPGELYIAGDGVASGYHQRPDLTAERFVADPFSPGEEDRMYRTGDLVRVAEQGDVFYLGRLDRQVKIRGFRIELGEIETAISEHDNVKQCVVEVYEPPAGAKRLVAYLILKDPDRPVGVDDLQGLLASRLPEYMIPTAVVTLDALPLTPNNKIDRKALPAPAKEHYAPLQGAAKIPASGARAPSGDLEEKIFQSWKKHFGANSVDLDSNFVSLGGDSLSYVQVLSDLEEILGEVPEDWERLTIRQLAQLQVEASPVFAEVECTVAIRAVSIFSILFLHFFPDYGLNGWTSGLFMVSGYLFAKFQFPLAVAQKSSGAILTSAIKILIPSGLFVFTFEAAFGIFEPSRVLMYDNLLKFSGTYWFIQVLIQILLFMALLFAIAPLRRFADRRPFDFGLILFAFAAALILLAPFDMIWDKRNYQLPQFRLWQFAFGWCVCFGTTHARRAGLAYALVAVGVLDHLMLKHSGGPDWAVVTVLLGLILLYVPKIPVIRPLHHLMYALAGASLYIYLVHIPLRMYLKSQGLVHQPYLYLAVGLLGGFLLWRAWEFVWRQIGRLPFARIAAGWESNKEKTL